MTRMEFLAEIDEILGLAPGTLKGDERLEDLENWDSTSLIILISLADANNGVHLSPSQIAKCSTVADLVRLARADATS